MTRSFATFILSHGRPENVITWNTLPRYGYTGPTFLILDDEDPTADAYRARFGADRVRTFSKAEVARTFDEADTTGNRGSVVYARNASYAIARELGFDYILQLDDDYRSFVYRWVDRPGSVKGRAIRNLDGVIEATLDLLDASGAACVAWSQGGDHMGGNAGRLANGVKVLRKAMNGLFLRTDRPVTFLGRINEDVNTYVVQGSRGDLFLTTMEVQLNQEQSQSQAGGMTELYRSTGTYVKSFYTVMMAPSCVTVRTLGRTDRRFHHAIDWDYAVPKIISGSHRRHSGSATTLPELFWRAVEDVSLTEPRFPLYVPTRGRAGSATTPELLRAAGLPYRLVVEPAETAAYAAAYPDAELVVLDRDGAGIAFARRAAQDHAERTGAAFAWQLDDDLRAVKLSRPDGDKRREEPIGIGRALAIVEAVVGRFDGIGAAGLKHLAWSRSERLDVAVNRNVAVAALLATGTGIAFRDGTIEDADHTLQLLAGGWSSVLFTRLVYQTPATGSEPGGNTEVTHTRDSREARARRTQELWPGAFRLRDTPVGIQLAPSRIWRTFPQRPELRDG